jgi:hypothetical protein
MYPNYSTNLKLVIIALSLISSISFSLSLNMAPSLLNINKFAFAQQNPVLPNYRGDHRSFEPSKTLDNQANLASNEIQSKSLVHYQPITPASNSYTGNSNEASMNGVPISIPNMINSTNPSSLVQPVSLTHYQPITPAGSGDPIGSTDNSFSGGQESSLAGGDNQHGSTSDGSHHSSNDNSHDGGSHSGSAHKSSSNHNNSDHAGRTSHHSGDHSSSHHHGASASAGGGGASASAGGGGASASAG